MTPYEAMKRSFAESITNIIPSESLQQVLAALDSVCTSFTVDVAISSNNESSSIEPELLEQFLISKDVEEKSKGTLKTYRSYLRSFFNFVRKKPEDISTADIRKFLSYCKTDRKYANNSLETARRIINGFFEFCVLEELIPKNPCKRISPISCEKTTKTAMNPIELEYMRESCKTLREHALVDFLYSTGCRVSEACNAKIEDIDWEKKTLIIRLGKGKKTRTTFLNPRAEVSLKAYLAARGSESAYIFAQEHGKSVKPLVPETIQRAIKSIRNRATSVKTKVTPHIFRHTIATITLSNGMPIEHVQRFLGHANINTTMIYAEVNIDDVRLSHRKYAG